ncbi:MAG TPA: DinB family protein [Longimicrobiales bacterium]|nr:DinB family protein [Longimicrobiales bacterium]
MEAYDPDEMIAEARRQRRLVERMTASLDEAAFAAAPAPGGWSVGQCLEHLALINQVYLDAIEDAAQRGQGGPHGRGRRRKRRHGWLGNAFVRSLEPPVRLKGRAFAATVPQGRSRDQVLSAFFAAQDRLVLAIEAARGLDFARVRMSSPFFRLLRLSLGQAFGAVLAHNRRHIRQAEDVLERKV